MSLGDLEKALLAGKIVSYAQGFAVLAKASEENGWNLPLATIAKIWRDGCIIRSRFLDQMTRGLRQGRARTNLLMVPDFVTIMKDAHKSLRKVVAAAALGEFPMICLSASLAYFDSYRQALGHREPDAGPARLLRRARLRADRPARRAARHVAVDARQVAPAPSSAAPMPSDLVLRLGHVDLAGRRHLGDARVLGDARLVPEVEAQRDEGEEHHRRRRQRPRRR